VFAALLDFVLIRPLRKRHGGEEALAIITIGINIFLATELGHLVGVDILPTGAPGGTHVTHILGVAIAQTRVTAAALGIVVMAGLFAIFRYTDLGVSMRATAADPETAALMGINLNRVAAISWALAGALAAIAGAFFAAFPTSPGVDKTTSLIALTAVPAAVAGGLDSVGGAVAGGLLIGVATQFTTTYQDNLSFLGGGLADVTPYIVLFAVLLWRPSGLFGTRETARV
jgi:branched-chain amino acid transport system permease protein